MTHMANKSATIVIRSMVEQMIKVMMIPVFIIPSLFLWRHELGEPAKQLLVGIRVMVLAADQCHG